MTGTYKGSQYHVANVGAAVLCLAIICSPMFHPSDIDDHKRGDDLFDGGIPELIRKKGQTSMNKAYGDLLAYSNPGMGQSTFSNPFSTPTYYTPSYTPSYTYTTNNLIIYLHFSI